MKEIINNNVYFNTKEILISDFNSALDLAINTKVSDDISNIILNKESIFDDFFDLKTKVAGEILQKYVNYDIRLAIVGDFKNVKSKALNDFIYECNNGKYFYFVNSLDEALEKLK